MVITPIKTRVMRPPKDDLYELLDRYCPRLKEKDILVVTSKIVAIHQGRCVPIASVKDKDILIKKEAEAYLPRKGRHGIISIKHNTLVLDAGIDESNSGGYYTLLPLKPFTEAKKIWSHLKRKNKLKELGIIIADSRIIPLHGGTVGTAIAFFGFQPLKKYRGRNDIFGRIFRVQRVNIPDSLTAAAVLSMGEGKEQTPLAVIRGLENVKFENKKTEKEFLIPPKEDIYYPLLKKFYDTMK